MTVQLHPSHLSLSAWAWNARQHAVLRGEFATNAVGCAVVADNGYIVDGANIELPFRRGMHAEVVTLSRAAMEYSGQKIDAILIAAEREQFTPCGDCMDWIWHLGTPTTTVICESSPGQVVMVTQSKKIMPFYPR